MIESCEVSVADLSAADTLRVLRDDQRQVWALEARQLELAAHWADLHPVDALHPAAGFDNTEVGGSWCEREEPLAGPGCPSVAEFCVAELGAVLGLTTVAAKKLIGQALELRHRLPRTWGRVQSGGVAPWRVRRIAEVTAHASPALDAEAMRYVDSVVERRAGRIGQRALEQLVHEAAVRFELVTEPEVDFEGSPLENAHETHFVHFEEQQVNSDGTMLLTAHLDLADALALKAAVERTAEALRAAGSPESLGFRQAHALGLLARQELAAPAAGPGHAVVLNVHLRALPNRMPAVVDPVARLEQGSRTVLLDQVRRWVASAGGVVRVQPVLDLNEELVTPVYRPGARLRRQVELRDRTCVFPFCARPATACDVDHVTPFDASRPPDAQTRSRNLGPLCRRHHRLKTFGRWIVSTPAPGVFVWTSPHGHVFLRHPDGRTEQVDSPDPPSREGWVLSREA